jgi:hypothetical protein
MGSSPFRPNSTQSTQIRRNELDFDFIIIYLEFELAFDQILSYFPYISLYLNGLASRLVFLTNNEAK